MKVRKGLKYVQMHLGPGHVFTLAGVHEALVVPLAGRKDYKNPLQKPWTRAEKPTLFLSLIDRKCRGQSVLRFYGSYWPWMPQVTFFFFFLPT